jgi:cell division protein FtsB
MSADKERAANEEKKRARKNKMAMVEEQRRQCTTRWVERRQAALLSPLEILVIIYDALK